MPQPPIAEISLKITYLNFCSNLPGANEFIISKLPVDSLHKGPIMPSFDVFCVVSFVFDMNDILWNIFCVICHLGHTLEHYCTDVMSKKITVTYHVYLVFNSLVPRTLAIILMVLFSKLFDGLMCWALIVNLLWVQCHNTPLIVSQHWFR